MKIIIAKDMKRVHIVVHGMVQGVFFRANTKEAADRLGLRGYAKNLPDGAVEIVAEGPKEKIDELAALCKKGPERARVDKAEVHIGEASGEFEGFEIRH